MTRNRRFRVALLTLFSVVMMQFALATYACPASAPMGSTSEMAAHAPCDGGDMMPSSEDGALCVEHCKVGAQHVVNVDLSPTIGPALTVAITVDDPLAANVDLRPIVTAEQAQAPPEHTVVHCCFRL